MEVKRARVLKLSSFLFEKERELAGEQNRNMGWVCERIGSKHGMGL